MRTLRFILLFAWSAALASCDAARLLAPSDVVGEYDLVSIEGKPLPVTSVTSGSVTIYSEHYWIREDFTFASRKQMRVCLPYPAPPGCEPFYVTDAGTWRISGPREVEFVTGSGSVFHMLADEGTLELAGQRWLFVRAPEADQ